MNINQKHHKYFQLDTDAPTVSYLIHVFAKIDLIYPHLISPVTRFYTKNPVPQNLGRNLIKILFLCLLYTLAAISLPSLLPIPLPFSPLFPSPIHLIFNLNFEITELSNKSESKRRLLYCIII